MQRSLYGRFLVIIVVVLFLLFLSLAAKSDLPFPIQLVATPVPYAHTSKVNESGKRHDHEDVICQESPEGWVWDQASVRHVSEDKREYSVWQCTVSFSNQVEILPEITLPRTACFRAYVVSVGGIANFGKKGELWCHFEGRQYKVN